MSKKNNSISNFEEKNKMHKTPKIMYKTLLVLLVITIFHLQKIFKNKNILTKKIAQAN